MEDRGDSDRDSSGAEYEDALYHDSAGGAGGIFL